MLQGLRYDPETKVWTTKTWELKKNPKLKTAAEEAKVKITDGDGLILHLMPGGSLVWRIEYRFNKTRKSYTVGAYTGQDDGVSLAEARETLVQVKKWIKEGRDPSEEKRGQKTSARSSEEIITFKKVARDWFENKTIEFTEKHRKQILSRLEKILLPAIGHIPIADLRGERHFALSQSVRSCRSR